MRLTRTSLLLLFGALVLLAPRARGAPEQRPDNAACFVTAGGAVRVCHGAAQEGVFYKPGPTEVAYNVQILRLPGDRFATVLHSEAEDVGHYLRLTGHLRPGDSIKAGTVDAAADPHAALEAPPDLGFRIWGSLTETESPLYYAFPPEAPSAAGGAGGGGNPMVVQGRRWAGDDRFYVFFLGVASDRGERQAWRDVLLEARTRDFKSFEILDQDGHGGTVWKPFTGEAAKPAIVRSVAGTPIASNQAARRALRILPNGGKVSSIDTAGLIGSIVQVGHVYRYFYTDEDPSDRRRNHLYVRTATDLSADRAWSEPEMLMDTPPGVILRIAKAPGMDRWAVFYNCLRPGPAPISDICLQYTASMDLHGPAGIGGLQLFERPEAALRSRYALGLVGGDRPGKPWFLKGEHDLLTDADGNLALPPDAAPGVGGLLTWMDMPLNLMVFGAPTYWGEWTVTPVRP